MPHEDPARARHGGSYFEQGDWWSKHRRPHRFGELRAMLKEILLLETVRINKPSLWWRSLLMHGGMYFSVTAGALYLTGKIFASDVMQWGAGYLLRAGLFLVSVGAVSLLSRRLRDRELRNSTHPANLIHLVFLALCATLLFLGSSRGLMSGPTVSGTSISMTLAAGLFLFFGLLVYIPHSQMAHFVVKYFAYHSVRWDDTANLHAIFDREIERNLQSSPTWAAKHIGDGKTWAQIASEDPTHDGPRP